MGIEPTLAAWEAAVLPLNYTRASRDSIKVIDVQATQGPRRYVAVLPAVSQTGAHTGPATRAGARSRAAAPTGPGCPRRAARRGRGGGADRCDRCGRSGGAREPRLHRLLDSDPSTRRTGDRRPRTAARADPRHSG